MSSFHPYPLGLPGHAPTSHFVVAFAAGYHGYGRTFSTSRSSGLCFRRRARVLRTLAQSIGLYVAPLSTCSAKSRLAYPS